MSIYHLFPVNLVQKNGVIGQKFQANQVRKNGVMIEM
jgi:hypothetical protein